jgi:sugar lactone lactonase YvrE
MIVTVFDDTPCTLGEGPLWHPERCQLFWFDIVAKSLLTRDGGKAASWRFDVQVSAAGWLDHDTLLIADEAALFSFDLRTGSQASICTLEADNPVTRSNDGRADPWGGFWIGTMGKNAEPGAGAIYRFFRGELRRLIAPVTTPNAICFAPDRSCAYFADTPTGKIWRQPLAQAEGWPEGDPVLLLDLKGEGLRPDGAVVDAEGCLWNAQYGAVRVARYAPDGQLLSAVDLPSDNTTCPSFGGPGFSTLYVTSALQGLSAEQRAAQNEAGMTFAVECSVAGQPEHHVLI